MVSNGQDMSVRGKVEQNGQTEKKDIPIPQE